ncbi:MAG: amidohydrolase [Clostridiales bacterium]|nr:amidohydrolase [Clostridiales bacterium]
MKADIIIYNGPVITVDSHNSIASAVAIKDNKIIYVGEKETALSFKHDNSNLIDLEGRSPVPGFIDSHLHMAVFGANSIAIDCRSPKVSSIEDIKKLVKEAAALTPKGQWIRGWGYDHSKLIEKRHPNRWDLDEVAPDHPVMLTRVCAHISAHNTKSLELAGLDDNSPDPEGGVMDRANGSLTGVMRENAHMMMMKNAQLSYDELMNAIKTANDILISQGITSIHDSGGYGSLQMRVMQDAIKDGYLKIRLYAMIFSFIENLKFINDYLKIGVHTNFGNDKFKLGPIKLMIDGSSSGPTAATLDPYESNPNDSGLLTMTQEQIDEIIIKAHKSGWQVTSHAVGDRAVTMILNSFEKASKLYPRKDSRHRIEHCAMVNEDILNRIKELNIVPISNPIFLYEFGDGYLKNYGKERAFRMFTNKSFIDKGIIAAGSSDSPITFSNPILNMHLAVNRATQTGNILNENERVTILEALRMFTYNGAYASFEEDIKGTIEAGKLADLVILSQSLLDTPADKIKDINVDMTIIDGEIVYERK